MMNGMLLQLGGGMRFFNGIVLRSQMPSNCSENLDNIYNGMYETCAQRLVSYIFVQFGLRHG